MTRPWSRAATGAAAAPSTTSLQRSITQSIASKISRSGSATISSTKRCTTEKLISPDTAHAQAVDDGAAVDGLQRSCLDAALHRRTVRRLDADHAHGRPVALHRHRHAGDEPAAADRHDDRVELGPVLHHFEPQRPLSGNQLLVVERVDVGQPFVANQLLCLLVRLVPDGAVQDDLRAVAARCRDLRRRGVRRPCTTTARIPWICAASATPCA